MFTDTDYRKIAQYIPATQMCLGRLEYGPEHDAYYDVLGLLNECLHIMTEDQRYELLLKNRNTFDIHFSADEASYKLIKKLIKSVGV